jgi:hypothetical protein
MINLTILGIVFLVLGLTIFALTVLSAAKRSNGNDNRFKDSIENLCMGAIVGVLFFTSMLCFNIRNTLKKESPQCMERADSNMVVIKPE